MRKKNLPSINHGDANVYYLLRFVRALVLHTVAMLDQSVLESQTDCVGIHR